METEGTFHFNDFPQNYQATPFYLKDFMGINADYSNLLYYYNNPISFLSAQEKLYSNRKNVNGKIERELHIVSGYSYLSQKLISQFSASNNYDPQEYAASPFVNNNLFRENKYWFLIKYIRSFKRFTFVLSPKIEEINYSFFNNRKGKASDNINKILIKPKFSVRNNISQSKFIEIGYAYSSSIVPMTDFFNGYLLQDYRDFLTFRFDSSAHLSGEHRINFQYNNPMMLKGRMLIANISYSFGHNNSQYNYDYFRDYSVQTKLLKGAKINSGSAFVLYEQALTSINLYVVSNSFASLSTIYNRVSFQELKQRSFSFQQDISVRTVFSKPLNFKAGIVIIYNRQSSTLNTKSNLEFHVNGEGSVSAFKKRLLSKLRYECDF